jgi:hypothetical protein
MTELARTRLYCGDNVEPYTFSNDDVNDALDAYADNDTYRKCVLAAADLCDMRASIVTSTGGGGDGSEISVGGDLTYKLGSATTTWSTRAQDLRKRAALMPALTILPVSWTDEDREREIHNDALRTYGGRVDPL